MDILDELTKKFTDVLDTALIADDRHNQVSEQLQNYCERSLSTEQSLKISELVGQYLSAVSQVSVKVGMKLGAKISIELLMDGGDTHV